MSGDMVAIERPDVYFWTHYVCRLVYWCGLGDCWYEPSNRTTAQKTFYTIYSFTSNTFVLTVMMCIIASLFKQNLTDTERNDTIQYSIAHPLIVMKWFYIVYQKERIKKLLEMMLVTTREMFFDEAIDRQQLRKSKQYCLVLALSMFWAILSTVLDSIVSYLRTGIPWRTVVTYYPDFDDASWTAYVVRSVTTFYYVFLVTGMLATDFLAVTSLIFISYKFKTLQRYFLNLKIYFESSRKRKSQRELEDAYQIGFIKGIKLHRDILWCASNTQISLGNVYSFQIVQTMLLLIIFLIKLVTTERNLTFLIATFSLILCMLVLTGVYMWSAGEITHEAALVSDAMFYSGWHLCGSRARMRKLLVVGIIRSQVPVVMTAFGVVELSYENFITIVKNSYSIFAMLY